MLNINTIGITGVINISNCLNGISTLRILTLADNNVSDEVVDAIEVVIKSNTLLEKISLDGNLLLTLDDNKLMTAIIGHSNLKDLQIDCKLITGNTLYESVDFIFTNGNIKEITMNYSEEEMHFLSPVKAIETLTIIKSNSTEFTQHMSVLHSVVMENRVEIVCMKDDVLVKSED